MPATALSSNNLPPTPAGHNSRGERRLKMMREISERIVDLMTEDDRLRATLPNQGILGERPIPGTEGIKDGSIFDILTDEEPLTETVLHPDRAIIQFEIEDLNRQYAKLYKEGFR